MKAGAGLDEETFRYGLRRSVLGFTAVVLTAVGCSQPIRTFPDRPVAWHEHDDAHVPRPPEATTIAEEPVALFISDTFTREIDRKLTLEQPRAAADVNARDEVPCSTWFCPRNHLAAMTPEQIVAGPPDVSAPALPLTIFSSKREGQTVGFEALDRRDRRYLVKLDAAGHLGLSTGPEIVGNLLFHAAGYNVPGAFLLALGPDDVGITPDATKYLSGVAARPFTQVDRARLFWQAARDQHGRIRAVAVPWVEGELLGGFDMQGVRSSDPNDRIPHQDRRSLRASLLMFAWLNVADASSINTLDSYVEEAGRRFVRHYFIDFGMGLGSFTYEAKSVHVGRERILEMGRLLAALATLGVYQRDWQKERDLWRRAAEQDPAVGWIHPLETWDPAAYRTRRLVPAHQRMTQGDAYWGAKVVSSFSDTQIQAVVRAAGYEDPAARFIESALRVRRDRISNRYLLPLTAVEEATVTQDGSRLCFGDLAIARGYAAASSTVYQHRAIDRHRQPRGEGRLPARSARTCIGLPTSIAADDYLVLSIQAIRGKASARPTRVHLRWRPHDKGFAVVGIERDET